MSRFSGDNESMGGRFWTTRESWLLNQPQGRERGREREKVCVCVSVCVKERERKIRNSSSVRKCEIF